MRSCCNDSRRRAATPNARRLRRRGLRRASLDLTGLPPTPAELDRFSRRCSREEMRPTQGAVDRLLASPRYGERMAMDWLDVARYADTNGFNNDAARTMWPWRDWVIDAFNAQHAVRPLPHRAARRRPAAGPDARSADRDRLQPQSRDQRRGRASSTRSIAVEYVVDRVKTLGDGLARPDDRMRPLPRPQVRPDHAEGVLPVLRVLQQRRRSVERTAAWRTLSR